MNVKQLGLVAIVVGVAGCGAEPGDEPLSVRSEAVGTVVVHLPTPVPDAEKITDLLAVAASTPDPELVESKFAMAGWHLGAIDSTYNFGAVGDFSGWYPTNYSSSSSRFQVANTSAWGVQSAMQGENLKWGGLMRHLQVPADGWDQPSLRYYYRIPAGSRPRPWNYGSSSKLIFKFYAMIKHYHAPTQSDGIAPIGWGQAIIKLVDQHLGSDGVPVNDVLSFSMIYFDQRNVRETAGQVESGEYRVRSFFGANTVYGSKSSSSADTKKTTWSTLTRFEYTITRDQFSLAMSDLNAAAGTSFSTEPSDYEVGSVNVALEATLNDPPPAGMTHRPFSMAYSGASLQLSTEY